MAVMEGDDRFSHFVTVVTDEKPKEPFKNWIVFNDYIATPVTENEALFTDINWKWPCVLFYVNPMHEISKSNGRFILFLTINLELNNKCCIKSS